ncbi:hypothetical protein [Bacillus sp. B15-48]|uniref:hypothetical protein n=1 Tax=Bacillus sp. B15-48 TaxID=1548601 RepID=UPI00193FA6B9|nr:hypothetical protein [Bacillus sp. B15-48]MBM4763008.1 hypothetical protein [Bacillus sp. B15-48]
MIALGKSVKNMTADVAEKISGMKPVALEEIKLRQIQHFYKVKNTCLLKTRVGI